MSSIDSFRTIADLSSKTREELKSILRTRSFLAGESIFLQDEPSRAIYIIASGRVKIVRVNLDGNESILCVRGPGDFFCPVPLLDLGNQLGTAVAMTDVELWWVDKDDFHALCQKRPELLAMVQGDCLFEVRRLVNRLEFFAYRSIKERLAKALLEVSKHQQVHGNAGDELHLTQSELAGLVGAARESVSRVLSKLEREGVVSLRRGRVIIRNREQLRKLAQE